MRSFSFILACLCPLLCLAQSSTTSVRGTVTDPHNAAVRGADVALSNPSNGFSRAAKTGSNGEYEFLQIPPGTYTLSAKASGFSELKKEGVQLLVSLPATVNFGLKVKAAAEVIEVTATGATINTQDATIGNAFDNQKVLNLPMEGRNVIEILSLQPGVAYAGNAPTIDKTFDSRGGAVNGGRSDQTNIVLDGVDNNEQLTGNAFESVLRSTPDSVQEFRVTTANSNADAGRSSGGQVSLVTKSGTNTFHGTLYEYHRPTFTTANDWFNKRAQIQAGLPNRAGKLIRNTFGGSIGGPIMKDRIFFFGTYEGQRTRESTQVTRAVPSDNLRQGIISYLCDTTDPNCSTANPLVTSTSKGLVATLGPAQILSMDPVVGQGVNPAIQALFQTYPHPNSDALGDGLNFRAFTFSAPAPENLNTYITKFDFKLTRDGKHNAFVRGNLQHDHTAGKGTNGPQFPGQPPSQVTTDANKGWTANYTALLTNRLINNFRYGYIHQTTSTDGVHPSHFIAFRGVDSPQGFTRSTAVIVPLHNYADDLTWTKGKHTLQFGGNIRVINNIRSSNSTSFFTASTNVSWLNNVGIANTGSSFDPAAFGFPAVAPNFSSSYDNPMIALAGIVSEVDSNFNLTKNLTSLPEGAFVPRHFRAHEWEMYGQDSWRLLPNLTITAGLRYTLLQPPYETTGTQVSPTFSLHDWFAQRGANMLRGVPVHPEISFDLSGQANGRKPYWAWDYADVAPRFAFAWSPSADRGLWHAILGGSGKTSIRGGYGIYYDHFGEGIVNTFDRNGSFGLTTTISNPAGTQGVDCAARAVATAGNVISAITNFPTGVFCGQNLTPAPPSGSYPVTPPNTLFAITWGLDDKLKTPYSHVMDFSVSRELGKGYVVEGAYVGRLGRRLLQQTDLAMPLDLFDPRSGTDYFSAMTQLVKLAEAGTPISSVAPIPYWENLFPAAAGAGGIAGCASGAVASPTATQNIYDLVTCPGLLHNETTTLFILDGISGPCFPACSIFGPNTFFHDQYSSLYAWTSEGTSSYNAMQLLVRKSGHGLNFDVNYTLSHSIDQASDAERVSLFEGGGFGDQIINSWSPKQLNGSSDFDTRHAINADWIYDLPYGQGRHWTAKNRFADAILGGWATTGLFRWSSGFPFSVGPGLGFWPTNWELTGNAFVNGQAPATGVFIRNGAPNVFKNGNNAVSAFRFSHPGESGVRNNFRGPGYFSIDFGLNKGWKIGESQEVKFSWEMFNLTNSVRFDVGTLIANNLNLVNKTSFGNFVSTATKPRIMQFSLRYTF